MLINLVVLPWPSNVQFYSVGSITYRNQGRMISRMTGDSVVVVQPGRTGGKLHIYNSMTRFL